MASIDAERWRSEEAVKLTWIGAVLARAKEIPSFESLTSDSTPRRQTWQEQKQVALMLHMALGGAAPGVSAEAGGAGSGASGAPA